MTPSPRPRTSLTPSPPSSPEGSGSATRHAPDTPSNVGKVDPSLGRLSRKPHRRAFLTATVIVLILGGVVSQLLLHSWVLTGMLLVIAAVSAVVVYFVMGNRALSVAELTPRVLCLGALLGSISGLGLLSPRSYSYLGIMFGLPIGLVCAGLGLGVYAITRRSKN